MNVICPYCEQDYVWKVRIRDVSQNVVMCLECDTVWDSAADVGLGKGLIFERFMAERGRTADWDDVARIEQLTSNP